VEPIINLGKYLTKEDDNVRKTDILERMQVVHDPATWSLLEVNTFTKIMAKEVKRRNRNSTTFSRSSWSVIKQELYENPTGSTTMLSSEIDTRKGSCNL
nr:hypothetical protein [Tanacetum cinerariifolium]